VAPNTITTNYRTTTYKLLILTYQNTYLKTLKLRVLWIPYQTKMSVL